MMYLKFGGALAIVLEIIYGLTHHPLYGVTLPLGGDHMTQLGIVLGGSFVGSEIHSLVGELTQHARRPRAQPTPLADAPHSNRRVSLVVRMLGALKRVFSKRGS